VSLDYKQKTAQDIINDIESGIKLVKSGMVANNPFAVDCRTLTNVFTREGSVVTVSATFGEEESTDSGLIVELPIVKSVSDTKEII
jgi:hypothetical protein